MGEYLVSGLLLDEDNPRFAQRVGSQREAMNALISDGPDKLVKLAMDIAKEGSTNPTELPVVVEENGHKIVIEGNRRLAALKLLRKPDLADDPRVQKQIVAAATNGLGPQKLECFLAPSRDAAKHWLDLRHTGENGGVGVVPWQTWQTQRFRRTPGTQADRAAIFCAGVKTAFPNELGLLADVETVRNGLLTTLGRLVIDPHIRQAFGFDFKNEALVFHYPHDEMLPGIRKIFSDFAGSMNVDDIKSKSQRAQYVVDSHAVLPGQTTPRSAAGTRSGQASSAAGAGSSGQGAPFGSASSSGPTATAHGQAATPAAPATPGRRTPPLERVIFRTLRLAKVKPRTTSLLKEAQRLDIDAMPGITAVMVRVLVELVVTEVVVKYQWGLEHDQLKKKIGTAMKKLDPQIFNPVACDKTLEPAWLRTQGQSATMVQSMNAFVHSSHIGATAAEVRELSATFQPLLERLDQYLAANP